MTTEFTLKQAKDFIKNNTPTKDYYPKFNFAAPIGWINDPNGVSVFNNELHLFYQHYPYDSIHGKMHWGHAKTKDGINWDHLDIALAPDQPYDKDGVFSGSAIEKDGKLYIMYTGHVENDKGEIRENQNLAISDDGINFKKYENNPVIDEDDVPKGSSISDFRDPKVFEKDGKYYTVIGSKTVDDKGQVLLYVSDDLLEWKFKSVILPYNEFLGDMVECPDLIFFENRDAFLLSAMNYTDKKTDEYYPHISWIIEGKVDWDTFVFEVTSVRKMDGGFDYYAPQTALTATNPNEYTAIAWQQAWNRTLPTHDWKHKWVGQMTIPRLIKEENGSIIQKPCPTILQESTINLIEDEISLKENYQTEFDKDYIQFEMDSSSQIEVLLFNKYDENISLKFDGLNQTMEFSRKNTNEIRNNDTNELFDWTTYHMPDLNEIWDVQIFVDTSSIQVFINDYYTLTSTFYPEKPLDFLSIESEKKSKLKKFKLGNLNIKDVN